MNTFPLFFKLTNQPVLIVGGGEVAQRKADLLSRAGACITILAPQISQEIHQLLSDERHTLITAHYDKKYIDGKRIVIAGTDDEALNHQVHADCKALNIPVNVVDTPPLCDFIFPAIVDRNPIVIGISSNGKAPVLARLTRARLETLIPQGYGKLAKLAGDMRDEVKSKIPTLTGRRQFWEKAFEGKVSELMFAGRSVEAEQALKQQLEQTHQQLSSNSDVKQADPKSVGEVYIVGAGPGDPELLTFKALRLMQQADIVYYDALVSREVLDLCRRDADKVFVGKKRSNHAVAQQGINQLMIDAASSGKRVVRLKGGDPFVFGRGGEEIQALRAAGIAYQVVPGITAAGAASCYTGIPLTHRDYAQSVRFVTGFLKSGEPNTGFAALTNPNETVIFYMGLHSLERLTKGLMDAGRSPQTPIAIISQASMPTQQVMTGTLADIVAKHEANPLPTPALLIVGEVAKLHDELAWYGEHIVNTDQQAHALNML
uniref:Siroheme synthase n=1 Tax=Psychrobacter sp. (strain PRwf-1) TaxID=349106 RepID=CYSG_PSYWF|nr:RecName: Full=Siroheme synthase; Includes: RecName: Full=Uroporphyrinogen-III C-methyltransferase; Short=Urogen III methylase; AltName: Full=SUMT; AltName: Full=Uroporphyrinogen III methylase; Short=UROM; Includes: RecName: Full=Precorrin-2 dehydrogenase; Includes: RecName: Full=Sirohydrochlorin ferrochelatase [Psychrobacter sp. PRwf-1]